MTPEVEAAIQLLTEAGFRLNVATPVRKERIIEPTPVKGERILNPLDKAADSQPPQLLSGFLRSRRLEQRMALQEMDPTARVTGDSTYQSRVERYNFIVRRLAEKPRPTYQAIANELGISKQNVGRIVNRGIVKPSGRQPSNAGRKARLTKRLVLWSSRRASKIADNLDVSYEDRWIADIEQRLRALG